jgi:uncharacterized damage-inducible protein DinB
MTPEAEMVWSGLTFRTAAMLAAVDELTEKQLIWRPPCGANPIAWMLWHIAEVEDNWVGNLLYGAAKRYPFGLSVKSALMENYPSKRDLLEYFREVRMLTKERLEKATTESFSDQVRDEQYGMLTVRQLWAGVMSSAAWHGGQIVYAKRFLPPKFV